MTITNVYKNFGVSMREERSAKRERERERGVQNYHELYGKYGYPRHYSSTIAYCDWLIGNICCCVRGFSQFKIFSLLKSYKFSCHKNLTVI